MEQLGHRNESNWTTRINGRSPDSSDFASENVTLFSSNWANDDFCLFRNVLKAKFRNDKLIKKAAIEIAAFFYSIFQTV